MMLAHLFAHSRSRPDVSFSRALSVAAFIGFWMFVVAARLVYLQVSQHDGLVNRARQQQQNAIETSPQRGDLLDRQGRQLARSLQTVSFFVDPDGLNAAELNCTADYLSQALGLNYTDLASQLNDAQAKKRRFVWVARRLEADLASQIVAMNLPGLQARQEPKRFYPNGQLASHGRRRQSV